MKTIVALICLAVLALVSSEVIPNHYLVQFHPDTPQATRKLHLTNITTHPLWPTDPNAVLVNFEIASFSGYSAKIHSSELLAFIKSHPAVALVEPDQIVRKSQDAGCSEQSLITGLWGKARISSVAIPPQDGRYVWPTIGGQGVDAYIIDTGIYIEHDEFYPNRAIAGANFIINEQNTDLNGHGTHVAGTVGGNTFGIATRSTLIGVKVLDRSGSGTLAGVIQGMEWVGTQRKERQNPSTANLSLGSSLSTVVNNAADALVATGVSVIVAAGNSNRVTCGFSPASANNVVSVAASDSSDIRAWFSNYGACTHLFAPGVNILSAYIGSRGSRNTLSGTSMAAPHVAGVATVYLSIQPQSTPKEVKDWLVSYASSGQITDTQGTPNLLLYQGCYQSM